MKLTRATQTKIAKTVAVALAGGTVLGTCQTRLKESFVRGSTDYLLYTLLSPETIAGWVLGTDDGTGDDSDDSV